MSHLETRKVQLTGGTTLTVSIPKVWADRVGLRTGDRVVFQMAEGNTLHLRPATELAAPALVRERIDARGLAPRMLEQRILGLYVAGCDVIEIVSLAPDAMEALSGLPRRLGGIEIVEQGEDRLVLQDFSEAREFDIAAAFDRMYAIASGIHRAAYAAIGRETPPPVAEARARCEEVERLQWVAVRLQRRLAGRATPSRVPSQIALTYARAFVTAQMLAGHGVRLTETAQLIPCSVADREACTSVLELGAHALQICDEAARSLRKADLHAADAALRRITAFDERLRLVRGLVAREAADRGACGLCLSAGGVLEWTNATALAGGRLADLAIQHAVESQMTSLQGGAGRA